MTEGRFMSRLERWVWLFPALALLSLIIGMLCAGACTYIEGDILGVDLDALGLVFYSMLLVSAVLAGKHHSKEWLLKGIAAVVSMGVGAELIFLGFQMQNEVYCPKCIVSGAFFLGMFVVLSRRLRLWAVTLLVALGALLASFTFSGSVVPSYGAELRYPKFGDSEAKVSVIVYSDYFCPACRKVDGRISKTLEELQDRVNIYFVDVPIHKRTVPYAEAFLYCWFETGDDLGKAMKAREILFREAEQNTPQEGVLAALKEEGVPFVQDKERAREVFKGFYSPLLRRDNVRATPTMVIMKGKEKKTYIGQDQILEALAELSSTR